MVALAPQKGILKVILQQEKSYLPVRIMITSIILRTVKMLILMVCMMWLGMVHLIKLSLEMAIMITTHQES